MGPILALFTLTLRQLVWSPKIGFALLLAVVPGTLAVIVRLAAGWQSGSRDIWEFYHAAGQVLSLQVIVPVLCMVYGTALIGAEVEARTFVYLTTRHMRRGTVLLVKYVAAALLLTALAEGMVVLFHVCHLGGRAPGFLPAVPTGVAWHPANDLMTLLIAAPLGVVTFLAVFTLIGLLTARPLALSVLYLVIIELAFGNLPLEARVYCVSHLIRKMMAGRIAGMRGFYELSQELWDTVYLGGLPVWCGILGVILVTLGFAVVLVSTRELLPAKMVRE